MTLCSFTTPNLVSIREALEIAEDKIGDFYKLSDGQWKRHRFDVKTLPSLNAYEITSGAFAVLNKYQTVTGDEKWRREIRDFYFICLQDHHILEALRRDNELRLLPLLVYIFTHELVHIVRFGNFFQRFEISGEARKREEKMVHTTTFEILKDISLSSLNYILDSYQGHRLSELRVS